MRSRHTIHIKRNYSRQRGADTILTRVGLMNPLSVSDWKARGYGGIGKHMVNGTYINIA